MPSCYHLSSPLAGPRRVRASSTRKRTPWPCNGSPPAALTRHVAFYGRGSKAISAGSLVPALTNPARCDRAARLLHLLSALCSPRSLRVGQYWISRSIIHAPPDLCQEMRAPNRIKSSRFRTPQAGPSGRELQAQSKRQADRVTGASHAEPRRPPPPLPCGPA
jgi:hypothetical protein